MSAPNPYQPPETPAEDFDEPLALPPTAFVSAGCSAMFVFFGGAFVLAIAAGLLLPLNLMHPLLVYAVVGGVAALLAAVSGWETLRLERQRREKLRRKRQQRAASADVPPSDPGSR